MKKRVISVMLCLSFILSGCSLFGGKEVDYSLLSTAITSPSSQVNALPDAIEFVAVIGSDFYEAQIDDSDYDGKKFVDVYIARNLSVPILLCVEEIKDEFQVGDIVKIVATVEGYFTSSQDDSRDEYLHLNAKSMKFDKGKAVEVNESGTYVAENGLSLTFKKAQYGDGSFEEKMAAIYFDAVAPADLLVPNTSLSEFNITQGDTFLDTATIGFSNTDASAKSSGVGSVNSGEKSYVYQFVTGLSDSTTPILIEKYDDSFNLVFRIELPLE